MYTVLSCYSGHAGLCRFPARVREMLRVCCVACEDGSADAGVERVVSRQRPGDGDVGERLCGTCHGRGRHGRVLLCRGRSLGGTLHPIVGDVVGVAEAEKVADLVQRRRLGAGRDRRHSSAR